MPFRRPTSTIALLAVLSAVTVSTSVAAAAPAPAEVYGFDLPPDRVLPLELTVDHPVDVTTSSSSHEFTLSPPVQAIPTPTAFEGGAAVLAIAALLHVGRRWRRRTTQAGV